jgi:hypothetical protein
MYCKAILVSILLCLIVPTVFAQETGGGLTIDTSPSGAEVHLSGIISIDGLTPARFAQGLEGHYQVRIKKSGYETYKSNLFLQPDRNINLTVKLTPKTRLKAAARSLLIPGWGQSYTDQKTKGLIFTLAAIGAGAGYFMSDSDFDEKNNRYKATLSDYNRASTFEEKNRLYTRLALTKKEAYDAENGRRIAIGAVIAAWGINLLDILFFFPEESGSMVIDKLSLKSAPQKGGGTVVLSYNF